MRGPRQSHPDSAHRWLQYLREGIEGTCHDVQTTERNLERRLRNGPRIDDPIHGIAQMTRHMRKLFLRHCFGIDIDVPTYTIRFVLCNSTSAV